MLEPLVVLTVLNCFFMFSSTVTTCALWWQYRSHRCCFKKGSMQQNGRHNLSKGKNNNSSKKSPHLKQDNPVNLVDRNKSNSGAARESKCRRSCKQRPRSSTPHHLQRKTATAEWISSIETIKDWEEEERARLSEACQTDAKSAVVMECSTVQKIVQILDNDMDLAATKLVIKDLHAKQHIDEKKELIVEPPLEPLATLEYMPEEIEQRN